MLKRDYKIFSSSEFVCRPLNSVILEETQTTPLPLQPILAPLGNRLLFLTASSLPGRIILPSIELALLTWSPRITKFHLEKLSPMASDLYLKLTQIIIVVSFLPTFLSRSLISVREPYIGMSPTVCFRLSSFSQYCTKSSVQHHMHCVPGFFSPIFVAFLPQ